MNAPITPSFNTRLGLHYYQDTLHYRESDLNRWLPELKALGITWISLVAPLDRAIPESFLSGLIQEGIEPILHFHMPLVPPTKNENLSLLFNAYASWGVHYSVLFDRPNIRTAWPTHAWAQTELVERFLDIYLPLAELTLQAGLTPVFPPLEPGGDYWDTAFLRAALQGMQRRRHTQLLNSLVLSAYAYTEDRPLSWGAGGPERWPGARPYNTPPGQQDQRGFYIFDWYLTLAQAVLHEARPILLFGAGSRFEPLAGATKTDQKLTEHTQNILAIARLMAGSSQIRSGAEPHEASAAAQSGELDPVPPEILSCNFWLLSETAESSFGSQAWFQPDGSTLPVVDRLRKWFEKQQVSPEFSGEGRSIHSFHREPDAEEVHESTGPSRSAITHYLLLPSYEWGIADWHLEVIRPFVKKHRPTIGFSLEEAALAARVTVIGGEQSFSQEAIDQLSKAGCFVERISGDGTSIATQLATR